MQSRIMIIQVIDIIVMIWTERLMGSVMGSDILILGIDRLALREPLRRPEQHSSCSNAAHVLTCQAVYQLAVAQQTFSRKHNGLSV